MSDPVLDTSDIDQYLGKPVDSSSLREPIATNDIRRWVHAMHYPNLLHYDPDFAAASRWGKIIAPQSFCIATDDGHGAAPACVGNIPNSHLLFGGDEHWFTGVRVQAGDLIVKINGQPTRGQTMTEAVDKMRGKLGQKITLTLVRDGGNPFDVTLARATITVKSVKSQLLESGYGYIRITQFQVKTGDEVAKAMAMALANPDRG